MLLYRGGVVRWVLVGMALMIALVGCGGDGENQNIDTIATEVAAGVKATMAAQPTEPPPPSPTATATVTPEPTSTPQGAGTCPTEADVVGFIQEAIEEWDDAREVANSTARIALSGPVADMQAARRDIARQTWPECAQDAQRELLATIDSTINGFIAFMGNASDADVQAHMTQAASHEARFHRELILMETDPTASAFAPLFPNDDVLAGGELGEGVLVELREQSIDRTGWIAGEYRKYEFTDLNRLFIGTLGVSCSEYDLPLNATAGMQEAIDSVTSIDFLEDVAEHAVTIAGGEAHAITYKYTRAEGTMAYALIWFQTGNQVCQYGVENTVGFVDIERLIELVPDTIGVGAV